MSRRPVDEIARADRPQTRQAMWDAMRARAGGLFSIRDIRQDTDRDPRTIASYLECLCSGGYAERIDDLERGVRYRLTGIAPVAAPRLRPDGTPVAQGRGGENMWRTMRMLSEFTARDVAAHATAGEVRVSLSTAISYCSVLHRAGYLRIVSGGGRKGSAVYRLIRNSGPRAPMIQRVKRVFDPNDLAVHELESAA